MTTSTTLRLSLLALGLAASLQVAVAQPVAAPPRSSGIDRSAADPAVRIQDDAFRAVNGHWLATVEIPADRNAAGPGQRLFEIVQARLRQLVGGLSSDDPALVATSPADATKIADLYASFIDEARAEEVGLGPMKRELARIDAIRSRGDLAAAMATLDQLGVDVPLVTNVHQDAKDSTRYVMDLGQGGIGVPNRDYLLSKDDPRFAEIRAKYVVFLAQLLSFAGDRDAPANAKSVLALETALAESQWNAVANRDPVKSYNPTKVADLPRLAPHVDWPRYLKAAELTGRADPIVISQPSFVQGLDRLVATTPLATWRAYFKTRLLTSYAPYLDRKFVDARFAFLGTAVRGTPENQARWKRGVVLVEQSIGEGLGRFYVAKYFPPESKTRMDALVQNLLTAYRDSIDGLDWMGPETKKEAQAKLATFMPKIGHPQQWRDYGALVIRRDDLVGNVMRARSFEYRRNLDKLGRPIDRAEWGMTPQTIDAYYNPELNEIVFPAGILQPPYFDAAADDAVNYGAIGAVIGHEISHGFDDQGSQYDGQGNLRDWWTKEDRDRFAAKTKTLIAQYDAYVPVPGYHVNGALTLGENIADNSGLAIAFKAYRLSLKGEPAPVIDGLAGDQRFFMGFAQAWQQKTRDASEIARLKSDPHSPGEFRANGTLTNQPGFYDAFGVKAGDGMYTAPEKRVIIW